MEILNQAMEFTQQYSLFFLAGMFAVILILVICMTVMNSRMKELQAAYDDFMRGNDGKSLEGILKTVVEDNKRVKIHRLIQNFHILFSFPLVEQLSSVQFFFF